MEHLKQLETKLNEVADRLKKDLLGLRAGRATSALVEDMPVEAYGGKMPLKQVASIAIPDHKTIAIEPWDKSLIGAIERAISQQQALGLSPATRGSTVYLTIPQLTEERRKALLKVVGDKIEEARIRVRRAREETWEKVQEDEKEGVLREDEKFKAKDEIQKLVDDANRNIDAIRKEKENEIMQR